MAATFRWLVFVDGFNVGEVEVNLAEPEVLGLLVNLTAGTKCAESVRYRLLYQLVFVTTSYPTKDQPCGVEETEIDLVP